MAKKAVTHLVCEKQKGLSSHLPAFDFANTWKWKKSSGIEKPFHVILPETNCYRADSFLLLYCYSAVSCPVSATLTVLLVLCRPSWCVRCWSIPRTPRARWRSASPWPPASSSQSWYDRGRWRSCGPSTIARRRVSAGPPWPSPSTRSSIYAARKKSALARYFEKNLWGPTQTKCFSRRGCKRVNGDGIYFGLLPLQDCQDSSLNSLGGIIL